MKSLLTDPVVLICCGVIVVGFIGLAWAIAKFLHSSKPKPPAQSALDELLHGAPDMRGMDLGVLPVPRTPAPLSVSGSSSSPAVSKDVADRLDSMTQRLAEMQALLSKQGSTSPADAAAHPGGVGQGFSPETIDKLLKIIGNVVQQVDILQKNLSPAKEGTSPKADASAASVTKP